MAALKLVNNTGLLSEKNLCYVNTELHMKLQQRQKHDEIPRGDHEISLGEISPGYHEISLGLLVRYLMVTMRYLLVSR